VAKLWWCILAATVLVAFVPPVATGAAPDLIRGSGINEGWFEFDVRATGDGTRQRGRLRIEEFGAANYDIDGRVVCLATSGDGAVVAATRPETDATVRVVFLAVRDLDRTGFGSDQAAPAFSVVSVSQPLDGLCESAIFLLGFTEPLDSGGVTVRDR
jgi:hypothetical protein